MESVNYIPLGSVHAKASFDVEGGQGESNLSKNVGKTKAENKEIARQCRLAAKKAKKKAKSDAKKARKENAILHRRMTRNNEKYSKNKERNRQRAINLERQKIRMEAVRQAERLAAKHDMSGKMFNVGEVVVLEDGKVKSKEGLRRAEEIKARKEAEKLEAANKEPESKVKGQPKISKTYQKRMAALEPKPVPPRPILPDGIALPEGEENFIALWEIIDADIEKRLSAAKGRKKRAAKLLRRQQKEQKKFNKAMKIKRKQADNRGVIFDVEKAKKEILGEMSDASDSDSDDSDDESDDNDDDEETENPKKIAYGPESESELDSEDEIHKPVENLSYGPESESEEEAEPVEKTKKSKKRKHTDSSDEEEEPTPKKSKKSKLLAEEPAEDEPKSKKKSKHTSSNDEEDGPATSATTGNGKSKKQKKYEKKIPRDVPKVNAAIIPPHMLSEVIRKQKRKVIRDQKKLGVKIIDPSAPKRDPSKKRKREEVAEPEEEVDNKAVQKAKKEKYQKKVDDKKEERRRKREEREKLAAAPAAASEQAPTTPNPDTNGTPKTNTKIDTKPSSTTTATAEQWNPQALEGDAARKDKFLRLLGAAKHNGTTAKPESSKSKSKSKRHKESNKVQDIEKVQSELERQYEMGMKMKHEGGGKRKGLGA